jgi:hypothetical protein
VRFFKKATHSVLCLKREKESFIVKDSFFLSKNLFLSFFRKVCFKITKNQLRGLGQLAYATWPYRNAPIGALTFTYSIYPLYRKSEIEQKYA